VSVSGTASAMKNVSLQQKLGNLP